MRTTIWEKSPTNRGEKTSASLVIVECQTFGGSRLLPPPGSEVRRRTLNFLLPLNSSFLSHFPYSIFPIHPSPSSNERRVVYRFTWELVRTWNPLQPYNLKRFPPLSFFWIRTKMSSVLAASASASAQSKHVIVTIISDIMW